MKEIQTCQEHCTHTDCIYRRTIGNDIPICFYAVIMRESRGCKISECDKSRRGTKKARTTAEYIEWEIDYDLTFTYQYQPENVTAVFTRFKGQSGKEVRDSFIKPNIISWTKEVVAKYNVSDIIGAEKASVNTAITDYVSKKFEAYGITVSNVSLINVGVDKKTKEVINNKIAAQQNAETQRIENQTKVDKAKADAEAKLIEAKAEAEANELLRKSLSDAVLKQQYLEKWDGKLPSVQSGDSMILDIGTVEKE